MNNDTFSGFKRYTKTTTRIIDKISVTTTGTLGFSTSFSQEHNLAEYTGATLYWNSYTREVGIQLTNKSGDDVLKLLANKNGYGYTVGAKSFFLTNKIDISTDNGRYDYRTIELRELGIKEEGNMFIIKLTRDTKE